MKIQPPQPKAKVQIIQSAGSQKQGKYNGTINEKHSYEEEEESPTQVADERFASPTTFVMSDDG